AHLLEAHPARARHVDHLRHDLEAEAPDVAVAHEGAEPIAAHGPERGDAAVDRELRPARAGEVVRDGDRPDRLERAAQRLEARIGGAVEAADRESAPARAVVDAGLDHARAPRDDRAEGALGAGDGGDARFAEAVLEADHRAAWREARDDA